jgi:leader peptidase (prepilin peptidase)/N-methyltransferase
VTALYVVAAALVGLAIGSFLNVVIWRVPRGESVAHPPSACPRCGHAIRPRDNVPVLSWLLLRGRCRDCGNPISVRYPLVEAGTGVLFAATAWFVGPHWVLPAMLYLAAISVALALIDIDTHRLPNAIVLPAYPVSLVLLALGSWNPGGVAHWDAMVRALIGAVALLLVYGIAFVVYPSGMGFGDVKLAGVLGLYLGWWGWGALFVGWFSAFLLGGIYSVALMLAGRAGRKSGIPFGPWMLLGAAVGIVAGQPLWDWYVGVL